MRLVAAMLSLVLWTGCARALELTALTDGAMGTGTLDVWTRSVTVTLPSGETARGHYTTLTTGEISPSSFFYGVNLGELLGRHQTERLYGYARLTGERGTVVELILTGDWLGHGFGVARTDRREEYRIAF
jgi:hypothetical protein